MKRKFLPMLVSMAVVLSLVAGSFSVFATEDETDVPDEVIETQAEETGDEQDADIDDPDADVNADDKDAGAPEEPEDSDPEADVEDTDDNADAGADDDPVPAEEDASDGQAADEDVTGEEPPAPPAAPAVEAVASGAFGEASEITPMAAPLPENAMDIHNENEVAVGRVGAPDQFVVENDYVAGEAVWVLVIKNVTGADLPYVALDLDPASDWSLMDIRASDDINNTGTVRQHDPDDEDDYSAIYFIPDPGYAMGTHEFNLDLVLFDGIALQTVPVWFNLHVTGPLDPAYTYTTTADFGGSSLIREASALENQEVFIGVEAWPGYTFAAWNGADAALLANTASQDTSFIMPARDVTVNASFTPVQVSLSVPANIVVGQKFVIVPSFTTPEAAYNHPDWDDDQDDTIYYYPSQYSLEWVMLDDGTIGVELNPLVTGATTLRYVSYNGTETEITVNVAAAPVVTPVDPNPTDPTPTDPADTENNESTGSGGGSGGSDSPIAQTGDGSNTILFVGMTLVALAACGGLIVAKKRRVRQ